MEFGLGDPTEQLEPSRGQVFHRVYMVGPSEGNAKMSQDVSASR